MSFLKTFAGGIVGSAISSIFSPDKPNYTVTESKLQDYQKYEIIYFEGYFYF